MLSNELSPVRHLQTFCYQEYLWCSERCQIEVVSSLCLLCNLVWPFLGSWKWEHLGSSQEWVLTNRKGCQTQIENSNTLLYLLILWLLSTQLKGPCKEQQSLDIERSSLTTSVIKLIFSAPKESLCIQIGVHRRRHMFPLHSFSVL